MASDKAAVAQAASMLDNAPGSARKAAALIRGAAAAGASLAVFPEAFLGGYPKSASFDETILYADIDTASIPAAKFDFDVTGHYARPDVFQLSVDVAAKRTVSASAFGA